MAEFDECQSLNRSFINEREDLKNRVKLILNKIETCSSELFIKDKLAEVKSYLKSLEKLDKNILSNIYKFDSLRELYISDRDTSFQYKLDTEEKIAIIAENLTKSSTPFPTSEVYVPPFQNSPYCTTNNGVRSILNLDLLNTKETPILRSEIVNCDIESSLNCKIDDNVDKIPVPMLLDTRFEHCSNATPKIAESHTNLSSLHNAYSAVPDLDSPREKSCLLGAFDNKFEIFGLKMSFDKLKLGHIINSLFELHNIKDFIGLTAFMKVNVLQYLSLFKMERFINMICLKIDLNKLPIWEIVNLPYTKQLPCKFDFYWEAGPLFLLYFKILPADFSALNKFIQVNYIFKFWFATVMDIIHYKCALLGLICCMLAAYFKTEILKIEYNAKYFLPFFEHFNFVCDENTFHHYCRIAKFPHFDFVLNAILFGEIHCKQMLVTYLKIPERETG